MTFSVKVDVRAVDALADRLSRVQGRTLREVAAQAVNEVITRTDEAARKAANADLMLSDAYVKSKTDLAVASPDKPRAELVTRGDLTILGRYPITQLTEPAKGPAKGDASRGIAAGQKAAGLRVQIKRSAGTTQPKWFTMTLRNGNGTGVFVRPLGGKPKHIYGPSPYSAARIHYARLENETGLDLARTVTGRITSTLEAALE